MTMNFETFLKNSIKKEFDDHYHNYWLFKELFKESYYAYLDITIDFVVNKSTEERFNHQIKMALLNDF
jgi:hypothetical protein